MQTQTTNPTPSGAPTLSRWKQRKLAKIAKRMQPAHPATKRRIQRNKAMHGDRMRRIYAMDAGDAKEAN